MQPRIADVPVALQCDSKRAHNHKMAPEWITPPLYLEKHQAYLHMRLFLRPKETLHPEHAVRPKLFSVQLMCLLRATPSTLKQKQFHFG